MIKVRKSISGVPFPCPWSQEGCKQTTSPRFWLKFGVRKFGEASVGSDQKTVHCGNEEACINLKKKLVPPRTRNAPGIIKESVNLVPRPSACSEWRWDREERRREKKEAVSLAGQHSALNVQRSSLQNATWPAEKGGGERVGER